jgi:trk system potassium uptake protein TrkH
MRAPIHADDYRIVLAFTGRVAIGLAMTMLLPLAVAAIEGEWAAAVDFLIAAGAGLSCGGLLARLMPENARPGWMHGMVASAFSWLAVMVLAAVPYALSGQYAGFLDCLFDAMSGFTTTGLVLIGDLDHCSYALNTWRHLITFIGGQGVVVLALTFLIGGAAGGWELYVGEGKDERIFPNVAHTAKAIWRISAVYLAVGVAVFYLAGMLIGLGPKAAFYHGAWMYLSTWSTGGFAPMSQSVLYYHSGLYEAVTVVFFVIGSLNFALHHAVLSGDRREIYRNAETVSFAVTFTILFALIAACLARSEVYGSAAALLRKGFYQVVSAHTTTGFMTVYARQFVREWGDPALLALCVAMMIGGSACSTAGGIKGLRVAGLWRALGHETKALLLPPSAVFPRKLRMFADRALDDERVKSFALITVLYAATWAIATVAGAAAGYPALEAAFEAASVTGNVGLSIGVTSPAMPAFLKIVYIVVMWAGRLEFMAVLALAGFIRAALRGTR